MMKRDFSNVIGQGRTNWAAAMAPLGLTLGSKSAGAEPLTLLGGTYFTCDLNTGVIADGDGATWCRDYGAFIRQLSFAPSEGDLTFGQASDAVTSLGGGLGFEIPSFSLLDSFMADFRAAVADEGSVLSDYMLYNNSINWLSTGQAYDLETGSLVGVPAELNGAVGMRDIGGGNVAEPGSLALLGLALVISAGVTRGTFGRVTRSFGEAVRRLADRTMARVDRKIDDALDFGFNK